MIEDITRTAAGFGAAGVVAVLAYRRGALARSGAVAAVIVGGLIVAAGGWSWGALLIAFFVSSSALSSASAKRGAADPVAARGHRRDAVQVFANGGVATAIALISGLTATELGVLAFAGAVAAANADTWSTEIGSLARRSPRLITTGRRVAPGTSGGVTTLGLLGALLGGGLIGGATGLVVEAGWAVAALSWADTVLLITAAGIMGSLVDSLAGATIQVRYTCPHCNHATERASHCGIPTRRVGGIPGITNDVVNLLATVTGAAVAGLGSLFL